MKFEESVEEKSIDVIIVQPMVRYGLFY